MISKRALMRLGFDPSSFALQNDRNGQGTYIAQWNNASPQPSEAEIETAHNEWQAEFDAHEYARLRATAYAPIGDQLDMQYWDEVNGTTTWADHVAEIKARLPK